MNNTQRKKPIYMRWWVWAIFVLAAVIVIMGKIVANGEDNSPKNKNNTQEIRSETSDITIESEIIDEGEKIKSELKEKYDITEPMLFARGDSTGKWKNSLVYTDVETSKYAVDYAKAYMQNGDVHFIINFYLKTTSMLRLNNEVLYVKCTEYVDKEEHDASVIGNGLFIYEKSFDMTTGQAVSYESDESTGTALPDELVVKVKEVIEGGVGENEIIKDVQFDGSTLTIFIDISETDTSIISARLIALSRISSITDPILDLDDSYTNAWETIIIDFGSEGKAILDKSMIKNSGYGKYFEISDDILQ